MIKLRQNTDKLNKAAQAARLAQIQAAAAKTKFETAREGSRNAKNAFKAAKKATKKAKRAARKADKAADRALAYVTALRRSLERAEKKKKAPRAARKPGATRPRQITLSRARAAQAPLLAPDLVEAAALVSTDSVTNN